MRGFDAGTAALNRNSEELIMAAWGEAWAERAAILEYEAGMNREEAERLADELHPNPLSEG